LFFEQSFHRGDGLPWENRICGLATPRTENRTVPRRKANAELRRREYLTGGLNLSTFHRGFTAAEKTEIWDRWKRGESLKAIGSIGPIDR
jgi:hypothetical protein